MKYIYFLSLILSYTTINAQFYKSGTVTDKNNQAFEGRVSIDNSDKKVLFKKDGNSKSFNFNSVISVATNGRLYSNLNFENSTYLSYQLIKGKASLYDLNNNDYLILMENGTGKLINLEDNKSQIPGVLGVLFNDCNAIRDVIYNSDEINERILKEIITEYNNCKYSDYNPTENEVKKANTFNTDAVRFYGGFQTGFNNTTINDFNSNSTTGFGLGLGISTSPGFTGNLQGNLYFDFDFSMIFTGDNDFNNGLSSLNYKVNSYRFSIGLQYLFNKEGTIQPFLGIGYGYTSDYYKGNLSTISFKDHDQNFFFIPKVGMLYKLTNGKHVGLTLSYISEYENNLGFYFGEEPTFYPFIVDTSAFNLGLNYYF